MNPIVRELLDIRSAIESLNSLAPGHGYDPVGKALTDIAMRPSALNKAEEILMEAERISPNLISTIQTASIESEIELELFHAGKMFDNQADVNSPDDHLFQDYQYDWFTGRSALEANFVPDNATGLPLLCYFGVSGIPFSALSLQRKKPSTAVWFDQNEGTKEFAVKILERLDIQTIQMLNFNMATIKEVLSSRVPDYATVLDSKLINKEFLSLLKNSGIKNISFVTTHGFNKLLYPAAPENLLSEFFEFKEGYYPARINGMNKPGWIPSGGLSFVSLALYKNRD